MAVFTQDDTAASAAAAKPDPIEHLQTTITELQQQLQAMAKTQEAMAKLLFEKQSDTQDQRDNVQSQSDSEASSATVPRNDTNEGSSKSWLPSMPSILRSS